MFRTFPIARMLCAFSLLIFAFDTAAYSPKLVQNSHQLCTDLDPYVKRKYAMTNGPIVSASSEKTNVFTWVSPRVKTVEVDGQRVYLKLYLIKGCGGACETYGLIARPSPMVGLDRKQLRDLVKESDMLKPQLEGRISLIRVASSGIYGISQGNQNLEVFKLNSDASWTKKCDWKLPADSIDAIHGVSKELLAALVDFRIARNTIAGAGGSCGSMKTGSRWKMRFEEHLASTITRLEMIVKLNPRRVEYEDDLHSLMKWASFSVSSYEQLRAFSQALSVATRHLSDNYQERFSWPKEESDRKAETALKNAFGASLRFYMFSPFRIDKEFELRTAVLSGAPLETIKKLDFDFSAYQRQKNKIRFPSPFHSESLLNISVGRPKVLNYLLEAGLDPNESNDFGKTPLMYAAQSDQISAVNLLLKHGADPNARTFSPLGSCFYSINTIDYTPLIYAARNASANVVARLLEKGASPYLASSSSWREANIKYPIDWVAENPSLLVDELNFLEEVLYVSRGRHSEKKSVSLNLEAEKAYANGDLNSAYLILLEANFHDPKNVRILNNLGLVSLKKELFYAAVKYSMSVVRSQANDKAKAGAFFNLGLIGEQFSGSGLRRILRHENHIFSDKHTILNSYLTAESLYSTPSRVKKIVDYSRSIHNGFCVDKNDIKVSWLGFPRYRRPLDNSPLVGENYVFVTGNEESVAKVDQVCATYILRKSEETVCTEGLAPSVVKGALIKVFKAGGLRKYLTGREFGFDCSDS